jgi:hypothetical protein
VYGRNLVYADVTGWANFEPWLSRVELLEPDFVWQIAETVPPNWYGGDLRDMERLTVTLLARRERVRDLIVQFRDSSRMPFPKWIGMESGTKEGQFREQKKIENEKS